MTTIRHAPTGWRPSPLMVRILSGSAILLSVIGLVYAGPLGVSLAVLILGGLSLYEFGGLSERMGYPAPSWLLFPLGAYFAFSGTALKFLDPELVLSTALVGGLAIFLFLPGSRQGLGRWAMGLGGALYVGMPFNYLLLLYGAGPQRGVGWLLFVICVVVASDSAALLVGMRLGRHPFFPNISPKKTVEGAIGSVVFAVLAALLLGFGVLGLPWYHAAVLGVLVAITATLGDLVESQMKRIADVKDSSHLIPGHGGVLDRLDSIFFPPILVYAYVLAFHLLR